MHYHEFQLIGILLNWFIYFAYWRISSVNFKHIDPHLYMMRKLKLRVIKLYPEYLLFCTLWSWDILPYCRNMQFVLLDEWSWLWHEIFPRIRLAQLLRLLTQTWNLTIFQLSFNIRTINREGSGVKSQFRNASSDVNGGRWKERVFSKTEFNLCFQIPQVAKAASSLNSSWCSLCYTV